MRRLPSVCKKTHSVLRNRQGQGARSPKKRSVPCLHEHFLDERNAEIGVFLETLHNLWHFLLVFIFMQAACGGITYGQNVKRSLLFSSNLGEEQTRVSLENMLDNIEKRYRVTFLYEEPVIAGKYLDSMQLLLGQAVGKKLAEVLKDLNLDYLQLDEETYVLVEKNLSPATRSQLQPETITGAVTDAESGETLPGVNVIVKGTTTGTSTDTEGNYELAVSSLQDTLVFSFVGYQQQEVPIQGRAEIDVALQSQAVVGEEMVVVGYGTQEKSDLTGSVSSISTDDFNAGVNASVDQLMQGASAGVQISQTSGEPGGGISVRIRGASSINASNQPLYVIDGLPIDNSPLLSGTSSGTGLGEDQNPRNPLNALNPSDVESIEILKDASATAIYGSRGANGVVLITTKKGEQGDTQVSYDGYMGIQTTAKKLDLLNTQEYVHFMNGVSEASEDGAVFSDSEINSIGEGTNWQDKIYRTAPANNHNISVSGGNKNSTYRASLNYFDQEGLLKKSGVQKFVARLNLDTNFDGDKGQMGVNINTSVVNNDNSVSNVHYNELAGPIQSAVEMDPTEPIFNEDGSYFRSPFLTVNNPVSVLEGISSKSKVNRTFGNVYFQYDMTDNLNAKLDFGYDKQSNKRDLYNSTLTILGEASDGIANISTLERTNINVEYTMRYDKKLNQNNSLNLLGGITYQEFNQELFAGNISGFPTDEIKTNNLNLGDTGLDNLSSNKEVNKLMSYLGRVNYNLLDKYLLTASIRADGSSRFGNNNKFGYFPSFSLAWRLAEEDFIGNFFEELKVRTSWGLTGNQEIGNFNYLSTFVPGPNAIFGNAINSSLSPSRIPNPDLKWEATEQYNIGLDASILAGRLSGSVDYFIKNTDDMLINLPLPIASGYSSQLTNVGKMKNQGIEFQINSTNINKQNFVWNTSMNFSAIRNEVVDLGRGGDILTGGGVVNVPSTSIYTVGKPAASYYGYKVTRIFQTNDNIASSAQPNASPGEPIFEDASGDGKISPDDRQIIGNPYPDFTFGIHNDLSYKNWNFDFFIQGQRGADLLNVALLRSLYPINFRSNRLAEPAINRWTPENQNTKWPSDVNPSGYGGGEINSLVVEDASYLRLKSIRISYHIPQKLISSATMYITGQNLITITDYSGVNPEANALGRSNAKIDYDSYPLARTYLLGVSLSF